MMEKNQSKGSHGDGEPIKSNDLIGKTILIGDQGRPNNNWQLF